MIAKTFALLFVLYNVQNIQGGGIKYTTFMKQPANIQELINSLHYECNSIDTQFDIAQFQLKTAISSAKLTTKLNFKQFQNLAKSVKDDICGPAARASLNTIDKQLDDLKTCNVKDSVKIPKNQIGAYLKSLTNQAYVINDYCSLTQTTQFGIDACINNAIDEIQEQLGELRSTSTETIEKVFQEGKTCVDNVVNSFESAIVDATNELDNCLNPTEAPPVVTEEEINVTEHEGEQEAGEGENENESEKNDAEETEKAETAEEAETTEEAETAEQKEENDEQEDENKEEVETQEEKEDDDAEEPETKEEAETVEEKEENDEEEAETREEAEGNDEEQVETKEEAETKEEVEEEAETVEEGSANNEEEAEIKEEAEGNDEEEAETKEEVEEHDDKEAQTVENNDEEVETKEEAEGNDEEVETKEEVDANNDDAVVENNDEVATPEATNNNEDVQPNELLIVV